MSVKSKESCRTNMIQLYERGAGVIRLGQYWCNWVKWAKSGIVDEKSKTRGTTKSGSINLKYRHIKRQTQILSMLTSDILFFKNELIRYFKQIHFLKPDGDYNYDDTKDKPDVPGCNFSNLGWLGN